MSPLPLLPLLFASILVLQISCAEMDSTGMEDDKSDTWCGGDGQWACHDQGEDLTCNVGCDVDLDTKKCTCFATDECPGLDVKMISFTIDHYNGEPTIELADEILTRTSVFPTVFVDGRDGDYGTLKDLAEIGMHGWSHTKEGNGATLEEEVLRNADHIRTVTGFSPRVASIPGSNFSDYVEPFLDNGAVYVRSIQSNTDYDPLFASVVPMPVKDTEAAVESWIQNNPGPFSWFTHAPAPEHAQAGLAALFDAIDEGELVPMTFFGANFCQGKPEGTPIPNQVGPTGN